MNKGFVITVVLIVLCVLAFLFQGSRGIWQPDEGYYAGTSLTMLHKQSLLIPYLGEEEIHLDKPPMVYWGIIGGLKLFGHNEFAVRFFHGLSFVFTSLLTGLIGFELFKSRTAALLSVIIYATMVVPFIAANFVTPDTPLVLWTTAAIYCFLRSIRPGCRRAIWQMLMCLCVGLGFLTKGPAVLIPCVGIFVFLLIRRQLIEYFKTPWAIAGVLIFIAVGLSWYIWISFKIAGAFSYLFDSQLWGRLVSGRFRRNPGLLGALIYLPVLVFGSLPWTTLWIEKRAVVVRTFFRRSSWKNLRNRPEILFLVCWFFVPLIILCLASSKLGFYVLPIFPALSIATARLWEGKVPQMNNATPAERIRLFAKPVFLCSIWIILLIMSKLALAYYPTSQNMKTLWGDLQKYLPESDYELSTVDDRADGLLFYGVRDLEHITDESNPYPTFSKTEHILTEIKEMADEKKAGYFLVYEDNEIREACKALEDANVSYTLIRLPYNRALLALQMSDNEEISLQ